MSALEDVLSGAIGKAIGGDGDKGKIIQALLPVVVSMLASGGLSKILDSMKKQGLSAEADSWVGDGESLSITGEQAKKVVGDAEVKRIADQTGLPEGQAADLIAKALPAVVDKASPEGKEPEASEVDKLLDALKG